MTKRAKSNEDRAKNIERRKGEIEPQKGKVTLEGILCQQPPVNQCNCVWYLKQ